MANDAKKIEEVIRANPGARLVLDNDCFYMVDQDYEGIDIPGDNLWPLYEALASIAGVTVEKC